MPQQHDENISERSSQSHTSPNCESGVSKRLATLIFGAAILLSVSMSACDDLITEQVTIVVAGHPTAEFTVDIDSGCAPMTVNFLDKSSGPHNQWLWKFGDGDTSADTTPSHTYTTPGTYTVSLKITDNDSVPAANDTEVKKRFIVVGSSIAGFAMDTSGGCVGTAVTFTPSFSGATSFKWDFGDGTNSTDTFPTHTFNTVGDFPITLSVVGGCGVDSAFDTVKIGVCPTFTITASPQTICLGDSIVFTEMSTDSPSHSNLVWDFGDGSVVSDTDNAITYTYADTGLFTVALTVTNSDSISFTDSIVDFIRVNDNLTANFVSVGPTFNCETPTGQFVVGFNDISLGAITNRIWSFGDGTFDSTNNPTPFHAYTTSGQYTVTLKTSGLCGADTSGTATVTKNNFVTLAGPLAPTIGISPDTSQFSVKFTGLALGVPETWDWTFGDGTIASGSSVNHTYPNVPDTFNITLTVKNSCSNTPVVTTTTLILPLP